MGYPVGWTTLIPIPLMNNANAIKRNLIGNGSPKIERLDSPNNGVNNNKA